MDWKSRHGDAFRDTRVLVTGGAGFIGSHLVDALVELGAVVVVIDDFSTGREENLRDVRDSIELVECSILDRAGLSRAIDGCQLVYHLAALGSVPASVDDPSRTFLVNVTGSLNVLEAARSVSAQRVVLASSASVYGDVGGCEPKAEDLALDPRSPYAASKVAMEYEAKAWCRCYGLDTILLRYFNVFGPRQGVRGAYASVIPRFTGDFLAGRCPLIHGDGTQSRDFTYVQNVVHADLLAAASPARSDGAVVNVGTGRSTSVRSLFDQLAAHCGCGTGDPRYDPRRAGDLDHSLADISRAQECIGYAPLTSLDDGLKRTVEWWRGSGGNGR